MSARPKPVPADEPFTVMSTIHGPVGWLDVVDTKAGATVAVCPRACFARKVARLLTESYEGDVRINLGPAAGGGR